jgi:hypothetical protein
MAQRVLKRRSKIHLRDGGIVARDSSTLDHHRLPLDLSCHEQQWMCMQETLRVVAIPLFQALQSMVTAGVQTGASWTTVCFPLSRHEMLLGQVRLLPLVPYLRCRFRSKLLCWWPHRPSLPSRRVQSSTFCRRLMIEWCHSWWRVVAHRCERFEILLPKQFSPKDVKTGNGVSRRRTPFLLYFLHYDLSQITASPRKRPTIHIYFRGLGSHKFRSRPDRLFDDVLGKHNMH